MALTLEQYAAYLDTRPDLSWPAPPVIHRAKARPYLVRMRDVRVVSWNVYGTLLAIAGGDLLFEHPKPFVMDLALDKTLQEFKMWGSMSRKPGQPAEYLGIIYRQVLNEQKLGSVPKERYPEMASDRLWDAIIKKLLQKDYQFDAGFFGSLNEFSRKVAYFFHASLQGTCGYPGLAEVVRGLAEKGIVQGLLADGQCFTPVQLQRAMAAQDGAANLAELMDPGLFILSHELRGRKPSERLFRHFLGQLAPMGIQPKQVLHIGSRLAEDVVPARKLGMRTGLFAGDKESLGGTPKQLNEPASRPDILLTKLTQLVEVFG
jgi:FMN phosphatase YigB (HAD superfamily)